MARHTHNRSEDSSPEPARGAFRGGVPLPPGAAAMLALQRAAGNVAVSRMISGQDKGKGRAVMPGTFDESDLDDQPAAKAPSAPSLSSMPETPVDVYAALGIPPRPSAPTPTRGRFQHLIDDLNPPPGTPESSHPPTPRPGTPAPPDLTGDIPKAVGAAVGLAAPAQNMRLVRGTVPNLSSGATGMAGAGATGDALSEVVKYFQRGEFNAAKFLGGILTTSGLIANAAGQSHTDPARADATRLGGLYTQAAGLMVKGIGEGQKWEKGWPSLKDLGDGDLSKALGAFVASAAPILQAEAIRFQRRVEAQIAAGQAAGPVPTSHYAIWAAFLAGGSSAGDFFSEAVKGYREGKINIPKMMGGLLGAGGAVALGVGTVHGSPEARYAGLALQEFGLAFKSAGEAHKWEDRGRTPAPAAGQDLEMQPRGGQ